MKPARVGAGLGEQDDQGCATRGFEAFSGLVAHVLAVWRIAENAVAAPVLAKAILGFGEEAGAIAKLAGVYGHTVYVHPQEQVWQ